jgi:Leucine-rich repeat (LRR) protein
MKADLFSLPKELLHLVGNYLLAVDQQNKFKLIYEFNFDWRNFMNTSKEFFGEWKKRSRKIVLKPTHATKFIELEQFRDRILPLIEVPSTQLELQIDSFHKDFDSKLISKAVSMNIGCIYVLRYNMSLDALPFPTVCPSLSKLLVYGVLGYSVIDLSQLTVLEEASFSNIKLLHYHTLSHLKSVSISSSSITDVSCFKNVPKLSFHQCHMITNVSSLENVHDLRFSYCDRIKSVSSLGRVYSLELIGCYGVTDISALRNVHTVKVGSVVASVLGISKLRNVSELHLQWPKVTSLSGLTNLTKLFLSYSDTIADISALKTLKELYIDNCPNVSNFQGLNNLETLELRLRSDWTPLWRYLITGGMGVIEKLKTLTRNDDSGLLTPNR